MKRYFLFLFLLTCVLFSCKHKYENKITLSINGRPLVVEIARTPPERERGLMYREDLGWNEGMLFIFKEDEILSFWMKNTGLPLSIAFLDKNSKVTDIFDMEPFSTVPVTSTRKCRYAIEVNMNFFKECNLSVGDTINLKMVE